MTKTTTLRPSVAGGPTPAVIEAPALAPLRRVVRCDAGLCLGSGAVLVAGAAPLADLAGIDPAWPAAAGAFLLVLGVAPVLLARAAR